MNPEGQTLKFYQDGVLLHDFETSTGTEQIKRTTSGREYIATTGTEIFRINRAYTDYQSAAFTGAGMPYAMFFNGGIAIHGTSESNYARLGTRASGGCARLKTEDALIVSDLIRETGEGHSNQSNQSFRYNGRLLRRLLYTDRIKLPKLRRYSGEKRSSDMWTYNAAVIVVDQ